MGRVRAETGRGVRGEVVYAYGDTRMTRTCSDCHKTKPLTREHWHYCKQNKLGFRTICIPCHRIRWKNYDRYGKGVPDNRVGLEERKRDYHVDHFYGTPYTHWPDLDGPYAVREYLNGKA